MLTRSLITLSDSYKYGHAPQYPPNTTSIYAYLESRVGAKYPETTFFGLQYLLKEYLAGRVIHEEHVHAAKRLIDAHMGPGIFNFDGWMHIVKECHGVLPLRIWALPEGTVSPTGTPLMAIENTVPNAFWLTNFMETLLSQLWYPCTVATLSREVKKVLRAGLEKTGCETVDTTLQFMLHDFGCRGATSMESAAIGGAAHLTNFKGTDTVPALILASDYYGAKMAGFSVPASEHSTMTSWGKDKELDAYINMLVQYPTGIVSIVIDSWDAFKAAENHFGTALMERIKERKGRVVLRPDSGDPVYVNQTLIGILGQKFGYTVNAKGYKVLPSYIRILQGDGMNIDSITNFLQLTAATGWAAENWVFGMGGGLLQQVNRDTQRFAFKCSSAVVNGERRDVFKRPATDPSKNSKRGLLHDNMQLVFENGEIKQTSTWDDVCERAELTYQHV